jgi:hypothetical protein
MILRQFLETPNGRVEIDPVRFAHEGRGPHRSCDACLAVVDQDGDLVHALHCGAARDQPVADPARMGVPFCRSSVLAIRAGLKTQSRRVASRLRVRIRSMIMSDYPDSCRIAKPGRYRATLNPYGAVTVETPTGPLGVKPEEFDFVCPWIPDSVTHLADHGDRKCWMVTPRDTRRVLVLEKWRTHERPSDMVDGILFEADGAFVPIANTRQAADRWVVAHKNGVHRDKWRSPWFMPRWAARTKLDVRYALLMRLQDLVEEDAVAEGARHWPDIADPHPYGQGARWSCSEPTSTDQCLGTARYAFANHWEALNGRRASWASNPWVWAYTFNRGT